MQDRIDAFVERNTDAMLDDIKKLVAIRSVKGEAKPGMPYGQAIAEAVDCAAEIARTHGFDSNNVEGYMLEINLNDQPDALGIICHLDVVPEGKGWTTPPYEADVRDGRIYGRGTADNKGPAVAAIYALKCARELGLPFSKNVRLMLGTDEENGSSDLRAYSKLRIMPPFCFSPDAAFPVYNIEKGRYAPYFTADFPVSDALPRILSIKGGDAVNIVPDEAQALVEGLSIDVMEPYAQRFTENSGVTFGFEQSGSGILIKAQGLSTHASYPSYGKNAITALIALLCEMPFADSEGFSRLKGLHALLPHGDYSGQAIGIAMEDDLSGPLTLNLGIIDYAPAGLKGEFDARCPICSTEENTSCILAEKFAGQGLEINTTTMQLPHHVPGDLPFIQTLLKAFEDVTGMKGECVAMGGGSYVHGMENSVAFGAAFPETETYAHAADEYSVIDELKANIKVYVQVILDMCK